MKTKTKATTTKMSVAAAALLLGGEGVLGIGGREGGVGLQRNEKWVEHYLNHDVSPAM